MGREYVIQVSGKVIERASINKDMQTGEVEVEVTKINILNKTFHKNSFQCKPSILFAKYTTTQTNCKRRPKRRTRFMSNSIAF